MVSYNLRLVKGGGALFVLLWNLLLFSYQTSALGNLVDLVLAQKVLRRTAAEDQYDQLGEVHPFPKHPEEPPWVRSVISALLSDCLPKLLYPLAGLLADARLGRYKVMRYSLWIMWLGSLLLMLISIAKYLCFMLEKDTFSKYAIPLYTVIYLINVLGTAGYHVNIIPFGIDQMEGASGEEIASFVHWYYWTRNFNFGIVVHFVLQYAIFHSGHGGEHDRRLELSILLMQMVFVTAAVSLDFIFSSKLYKDAKIYNTVQKIKDITRFVCRHKNPVGRRMAYTFTYQEPPARSDFAKVSYGGPYKDDEVEEVVSFWRILVVLLGMGFGVLLIQTGYYMYPSFYKHFSPIKELKKIDEYLTTDLFSITTFTLSIPLYEFLVYPFIRNFVPRTTVRIAMGMFIALLGFSAMLTLDAMGHKEMTATSDSCFFYDDDISKNDSEHIPISGAYWILLIVAMAFGEMLIYIPTLEFICAQSPYSMRGFIIGIFFMIYGLVVGFMSIVLAAFAGGMRDYVKLGKDPSCGTSYITATLGIGCVGFMLYVVIAKRYRKRQRGGQRDVNQQTVLEGYFER